VTDQNLWQRYREHLCASKELGMTVDISRMDFDTDFFSRMAPAIQRAFDAMEGLEAGEIANPDEKRMVGHYWLRNPSLAPTDDIGQTIQQTQDAIRQFADDVHTKRITPPERDRFTDVLLIGIGGSALGPQLVSDALGAKRDKLRAHFMDNTDPDGFRRVLDDLGTKLRSTLVLVISKSGGTAETRNGMLAARRAFDDAKLDFAQHAVAITGEGSKLDQQAKSENWLKRFPMWDWVGGRTSVTSAVGLVPAALQGIDTSALLDGAATMDKLTRDRETKRNPAALLALMWHFATGGQSERAMVILPYKDRLLLLSRYLQQLVMESLGKEVDLDGNTVRQGITVYGNKGSTDQHAYVQQLRDGPDDFFATFIRTLEDVPRPARATPLEVDEHVTSGDYLQGFWFGTRQALYEKGHGSITLTLDRLDARTLGAMIALYERAVGYYAELVRINAYHQPGVEAGKKAAQSVLDLQQRAIAHLQAHSDETFTAESLADALGAPEQVEALSHMLDHLVANKRYVVRKRNRYQAKNA